MVYFLSQSEMKWDHHYPVSVQNTVEALVTGHRRGANKVSITGAGARFSKVSVAFRARNQIFKRNIKNKSAGPG